MENVTSNPCAWCEAEAGVMTKGSHGICERHLESSIREYELQSGKPLLRDQLPAAA